MTDEEIRIAIAEVCGLFKIMPLRRTTRKGKEDPNGVVLWYCEEHHGGAATYAQVPDYPNDLNSMHEAKKMIYFPNETPEQAQKRVLFEMHLCDIVEHPLNATARQEAEAFLRTFNVWKE